MQHLREIFEVSIALFLIMDPFANSTASIAILKDYAPPDQRKIILREMLIALGIMILFQFFGSFLLNLLSIEKSTLRIAGGIILFIIKVFFEQKIFYYYVYNDYI
jgi:multiple antibiotic resistance protein